MLIITRSLFKESQDVSQGLLDDIKTNVTLVTLLKQTPSPKDTVKREVEAAALTKADKLNIFDAFASTIEVINLQRAAVSDALQVLLTAKLNLATAFPSGPDLINMIAQVQ